MRARIARKDDDVNLQSVATRSSGSGDFVGIARAEEKRQEHANRSSGAFFYSIAYCSFLFGERGKGDGRRDEIDILHSPQIASKRVDQVSAEVMVLPRLGRKLFSNDCKVQSLFVFFWVDFV